MTAGPAIDMSGTVFRNYQTLDRTDNINGRPAWWVLCLSCRREQPITGANIRKAIRRPEWPLLCRGCGQ